LANLGKEKCSAFKRFAVMRLQRSLSTQFGRVLSGVAETGSRSLPGVLEQLFESLWVHALLLYQGSRAQVRA
jgi:hypothetical protein